jgi:hypothetical protein
LAFARQEVALPIFGLPVIGSVLNQAINLYGENILADMLIEPEAARHDLDVINKVLIQMHQWYRSVIPQQQLQATVGLWRTQPPGYGQLCGCSTHLLSGPLYKELIMPLDDALLAAYPHGGMIHLCGSHTQHLGSFSSMPHLKAVQLNDRASTDLPFYFEGLRDDQIIYLCTCPGMSLEQAMEITKGRRLVLVGDYKEPVPMPALQNALDK